MASLEPEGNEMQIQQNKTKQHKCGCDVVDGSTVSVFTQTVAGSHYSEQAPFAVGPSLFHLRSGESLAVEVSM